MANNLDRKYRYIRINKRAKDVASRNPTEQLADNVDPQKLAGGDNPQCSFKIGYYYATTTIKAN